MSPSAIIDRPLLDGTPLLVEFDGVRWSPIPGQLVMFTDEGTWVPSLTLLTVTD